MTSHVTHRCDLTVRYTCLRSKLRSHNCMSHREVFENEFTCIASELSQSYSSHIHFSWMVSPPSEFKLWLQVSTAEQSGCELRRGDSFGDLWVIFCYTLILYCFTLMRRAVTVFQKQYLTLVINQNVIIYC